MTRARCRIVVLLAAFFVVAGCGEQAPDCVPVPEVKVFVPGTQGYRIWSGPTLRTFYHRGLVHCIPDGWEAVGAEEQGDGWARYHAKQTGVIVRSDAFAARVARFDKTPFEVKIVWPVSTSEMDMAALNTMIERAFEDVSALYPRLPDELATRHTVLVTAGVAGDTLLDDGRIYPEPGPFLSVVVREPEQWRSEELFVHAVAHLYNRHRPYWLGNQEERLPIPKGDWEELVATWTETAFISRHDGRMSRLDYLFNIHQALQLGRFSLIIGPPFDDPEGFPKIHPDVIVDSGSPDLDYQYGHYVLAPLAMVATEGLLAELADQGTIEKTRVATLLTEVHDGDHDSYFAALEKLLPQGEYERIRGWMHRNQAIPWALVEKGAEYYATRGR